MKHRAIALAPQKKEIIIILLICLRYDERHKAEDWIRCRRSCSSWRIQTLSAMCSKMCICLSLYHCAFEFQCVLTIYLSIKKVFYHAYSCNGINRTVLTCLQMWINHVKINFPWQPSQNVSYSVADHSQCLMNRKGKGVWTKWSKIWVHKNAKSNK